MLPPEHFRREEKLLIKPGDGQKGQSEKFLKTLNGYNSGIIRFTNIVTNWNRRCKVITTDLM